MRHFAYIVLIFFLLFGCSQNSKQPGLKLQPGTPAYKTAKELATIYPFLDPDKNLVILDCDKFTVTTGDIIDEINFFFPMLFRNMKKEKNPVKAKKFFLDEAENTALHRIALIAARAENISVSESDVDSLVKKFRVVGVKPNKLREYLDKKGKTIEDVRKWVREGEMVKRYYKHKMKGKVTVSDAEIREYYNKSTYLNVRKLVLFVNDQKQGERARKRALLLRIKKMYEDGFSFSELVKKYSEDYNSSSSGGLIKGVRMGQFPEDIEKVLFSLKEGEVSKIVETPFALYLFKLEKRVEEKRPFKEVYYVYKSQLENEKRIKAYRQITAELKKMVKCRIGKEWSNLKNK